MPERIQGPRTRLSADALSAIYTASKSLDEPWARLVGFILLTGLPIDQARRLQPAHIDYQVGALQRKVRESLQAQRLALSDPALACATTPVQDASFLFQTLRGERRGRPAYLRPSILRELQLRSGFADWSWRDLAENVRHQMRILAVTHVVDGKVRLDPRSTAEAWADTLEHLCSSVKADPLYGVVI